MRYAVEQKEQTRERILHAAAKRIRTEGTEAVSVADLMAAAGLTVGGFYKHFENKDQLLSLGIETALSDLAARIRKLTEGMQRSAALQTVIEFYLSEEHLRHPETGCALAALGTEMARMPRPLKQQVSGALELYAQTLNYLMPGETELQRRQAFFLLFSSMAGCLMAVRVSTNRLKQREMLAAGRFFFTQCFCADSK